MWFLKGQARRPPPRPFVWLLITWLLANQVRKRLAGCKSCARACVNAGVVWVIGRGCPSAAGEPRMLSARVTSSVVSGLEQQT